MKLRAPVIYGVLVVLPTLLVSGLFLRLLRAEQARIARSAESAAQEQARAVADNIVLTVDEFTDELGRSLEQIPALSRADKLREWEARNPLIRNVFIWREAEGLLLPDLRSATDEERHFAARFAALFDRRVAWEPQPADPRTAAAHPAPSSRSVGAQGQQTAADFDESRAGQDLAGYKQARQEVRQLAKMETKPQAESVGGTWSVEPDSAEAARDAEKAPADRYEQRPQRIAAKAAAPVVSAPAEAAKPAAPAATPAPDLGQMAKPGLVRSKADLKAATDAVQQTKPPVPPVAPAARAAEAPAPTAAAVASQLQAVPSPAAQAPAGYSLAPRERAGRELAEPTPPGVPAAAPAPAVHGDAAAAQKDRDADRIAGRWDRDALTADAAQEQQIDDLQRAAVTSGGARRTGQTSASVEEVIRSSSGIGHALPSVPGAKRGWLPWFADNAFTLLGWARDPSGDYYGVEVETTALISRFAAVLPSRVAPGQVLALLDASGAAVFQRGDAEWRAGLPRIAAVSLAPTLPHWEVAVFRSGPGLGGATARATVLLGAAIIIIFVLTSLTGGGLLLTQARRNALDAQRKTTFVANVSHELKTPLTTIRMYAEMLGEGRVREEARQRSYLDTIIRESQRLTRLVNNVLDFSRLEQGRKRYQARTFDLTETLELLLREQEPRLAEAGIALHADLAPGIEVTLDRDALEQAVLNLIDNAIKYAAAGGRLDVRLAQEDGRCVVSVTDAGPGVPPAHRERIFDRFHRVDDSLTAAQPGSGLGLTIARRLLRDQGGDVVHAPAPGGGACFRILLPCRGAAADAGPKSEDGT